MIVSAFIFMIIIYKFTYIKSTEIMNVIVQKVPYIFKKIKTYSAEEILKAEGTTEFGKNWL